MNSLRLAIAKFLRRSANVVSPDSFFDLSWPLLLAGWLAIFGAVFFLGTLF